jgi:DnaJ family protein C protein 9
MDEEKRRLYDTTGEIDDSVDLQGTYDYYRHVYPTIKEKDIEDFSLKYRFSEIEKEDLIQFYKDHNGDMTHLIECIPLSTNEDVDRYLNIYEELFKNKILKKNKNYNSTKTKINLIEEDDEEEVEEEKNKFNDLCKQIAIKQANRGSLLNNISKTF